MFSGIVEEVGTVIQADHTQQGKITLVIQAQRCLEDSIIGDSIAVNGICLTVCHVTERTFLVEVMPETVRCTNVKFLSIGDLVNLERSLKAISRIGGHIVQGHVDNTTSIEKIEQDGCSLKIWFKKPQNYADCFISKGYVCIDGMSLTLVDIEKDLFSICFIPHTQKITIVHNYQIGTHVNVEIDHITKTVSAILKMRER